MFGRYSANSFQHIARQVRHHIGSAYAQARHFASSVDRGIQLASRVYAAANPVLQDLAPQLEKRVSGSIVRGKAEYDAMRSEVINAHDRGIQHAQKLKGIPELLGL